MYSLIAMPIMATMIYISRELRRMFVNQKESYDLYIVFLVFETFVVLFFLLQLFEWVNSFK